MANIVFRFTAPTGFSPTLKVYRADSGVLLGSAAAVEATAKNHYSATIDVGSYSGDVLGSLEDPDGAFFGSTSDPVLRSDKPISIADITDAVQAAGITLSDANVTAIAAAVYRRIAGGRPVGVAANVPDSGSPLDWIHSTDLDYSFDAVVAADSTLVFTIRRDVADELAKLELEGSTVTVLNGVSAEIAGVASIVRVNSTTVRVRIEASILVQLPPGAYVAEARELTAAGATVSRLEVPVQLRRSASRAIA